MASYAWIFFLIAVSFAESVFGASSIVRRGKTKHHQVTDQENKLHGSFVRKMLKVVKSDGGTSEHLPAEQEYPEGINVEDRLVYTENVAGQPANQRLILESPTRHWTPGFNPQATSTAGRMPLVWTALGEGFCAAFQLSFRTAVAQLALDKAHGNANLAHEFYLVADKVCGSILQKNETWLAGMRDVVKLNIVDVSDVQSIPGADISMFKFGSAVRLYLAMILPVHRFLYVDSDALVTGSLGPIVASMEQASDHVLFLSEEVESSSCRGCGYYKDREIKWGPNGLNAGILGVNVSPWRAKNMSTRVVDTMRDYVGSLKLGDQDVLNIISRDDPTLLQVMPCDFNLRTDSKCRLAPRVLHGNRGVFNGVWSHYSTELSAAADKVLLMSPNDMRKALPTSLWEIAFPASANATSPSR